MAFKMAAFGALCLQVLQLTSAAPVVNALDESLSAELDTTTLEKRSHWPKRGLPFNNAKWIHNFNGKDSQVNWAYNWESRMPDDFPGYLEYIPMLWGTGDDKTGPWFDNVNNAISRGSGHVLSFNEPDRCGWGQSCMTPQQAVDAYHRFLQPLGHRCSLGAPAVTSQDSVGLPWLREFMNRCQDCKIDFVPVHWYGDWTHDGHFKWFIEEASKIAGDRKIWITEFTAFGSTEQQMTFLRSIMPWLDNQPYVYRYSWFWAQPDFNEGALVKYDGWPSDLGNVFTYTPYGQA